ncbi:vanadium-dependent haloperoxidase [Maribacter sp. 2307ULW6-5]|uniref:vanadium-dependent haloperoxidase n=1 Tax=Maribacter sp. 2307ULW6-5 TaxID=3386275 RepID=UPI0039BD53AF
MKHWGAILFFYGLMPSLGTAQESVPSFMFALDAQEFYEGPKDRTKAAALIAEAQQTATDRARQQVRYWNAAYPSYRWHQAMVTAGQRTKGHKNGGRMAILHLAVHDAMAAVWEYKQQHPRSAPYQDMEEVQLWAAEASYSPAICEYAATAAAAHRVISHYFPAQKAYLDGLLEEFKKARLLTGLQYPADIDAGLRIGEAMAQKYLEYAKTDRTDAIWTGSLPKDPNLWSGTPSKWDPMKRQWKPFTLEREDQFRPGPPPADWSAEMEELREFNRNNQISEIAWKWRSQPVWDLLLERKIMAYGLDAFAAARASALFHVARFDATIAAWDGKYHYWGIRPFQYDPDFKPILVDTPNFPGYPAGHTTVAGALAAALSHLFPLDADHFQELALECSESRFEGGVHFRTDNEVGLDVGAEVGKHVIEHFRGL